MRLSCPLCPAPAWQSELHCASSTELRAASLNSMRGPSPKPSPLIALQLEDLHKLPAVSVRLCQHVSWQFVTLESSSFPILARKC